MQVNVGRYNRMKIARFVSFGAYLDDGDQGILLPIRYLPPGLKEGDELKVFVYHDSEDRLVATTEKPFAQVGEFAMLEVVDTSPAGAFMNWGLPKDLFVPKSKQIQGMRKNGHYLVYLYIDHQTGRVAATEKIDPFLSNEVLTVKPLDPVQLLVWRRTDIGYLCIINHQHTGVLHHNDIFTEIHPGKKMEGFVKAIREDNKIDLASGKRGMARVEDGADKILRLLQENNGYLPYHDKSDPEEIYTFFGMSKKTFKMTIGGLFKQHKIELTKTGIKLLN